ncbi:SAM-dependent methyltransferase domain-containing protein [Sinorhizobium fredii]|uniref:SAM-dependent methyltransferase domain-containing protein n=1 Tax=Rhizobium fredii TaxID=380 RepID=A0A2L0H5W1_RHIFR|nr:SAM-dependent methyltransferase domain-containing protein [Sinorhizobium fredii]
MVSAYMIARGFDVTPTDGSPELAAEAERLLGRPVGVVRFEELSWRERFDGIWAEACLLHVPRTALPDVLTRLLRALKFGGVLHASFKAGGGRVAMTSAATTTIPRTSGFCGSSKRRAGGRSKSPKPTAAAMTASRHAGCMLRPRSRRFDFARSRPR